MGDVIACVRFEVFGTAVGPLTIAADDEGLRHIEFSTNRHPASREGWTPVDPAARPTVLVEARRQLGEYFAGTRRTFDLPLSLHGSPFQVEVWRTLAEIPYGRTWSYSELARTIGKPLAVRAVGAANGRNPIPIVLPCHRVIGADGSLTGFGGGLPIKEALLRLEGARTGTGGTLFD